MRAGLLLLLAALFTTPAGAQNAATEGEAHILSAFTTRADPHVLAPGVNVGPTLREQLRARTDIYAALVEQTVGKRLRVTVLPPAEAQRHAAIPGVAAGEPFIRLEAGELALLMQYAPDQKAITFVERISVPEPVAELPPAPPVPPAVVAAPLAAPPVAVEKPEPALRAAAKPASKPAPAVLTPKPAPAVAATAAPAAPKPRGDCLIKPVMSEQDLWNCSGPSRSTPILAAPAVDVEIAPAAPPAPPATPQCVIKPVMSDADLRACGARR